MGHVGVCTVKAGQSLYSKVRTCRRLYNEGGQAGVSTVRRAMLESVQQGRAMWESVQLVRAM